LALGRLTSENQCRCADHIYTASNTYSDFNANACGYSDADTMHGEMLTHAEASRRPPRRGPLRRHASHRRLLQVRHARLRRRARSHQEARGTRDHERKSDE
jgi:hypothetical protein